MEVYIVDLELEYLKKEIDKHRPFPSHTAKSLQDSLMLEYNQESNAIEGNSLNLYETMVLLERGITAGGKPLKDHLDIINHEKAIDFLLDLVKEKKELSLSQILDFNYLILKDSEHSREAGKFRKVPVSIKGASYIPTQPYLIEKEIEELIAWNNANKELNPVIRAIILHTRFVQTHPFIDGNGRTARLLLNLELLKTGYPIAILRARDRVKYYEALANTNNRENYTNIIKLVQNSSKETALYMLDILGCKKDIHLSKSEIINIKNFAKQSPRSV